jgi:hypothetical protein
MTPGWRVFDPQDHGSIAILGTSLTGAESGDHEAVDAPCAYWNTILPEFPQVRSVSLFVSFLRTSLCRRPFHSAETGRVSAQVESGLNLLYHTSGTDGTSSHPNLENFQYFFRSYLHVVENKSALESNKVVL